MEILAAIYPLSLVENSGHTTCVCAGRQAGIGRPVIATNTSLFFRVLELLIATNITNNACKVRYWP